MFPREDRFPALGSQGYDFNLDQEKKMAEGVGFEPVALPEKYNDFNSLIFG
jgi:hypothetical protein